MCQIHYLRHQGSESLIFPPEYKIVPIDLTHLEYICRKWYSRAICGGSGTDRVTIFLVLAQMCCNSGSKGNMTEFMPFINDVECECSYSSLQASCKFPIFENTSYMYFSHLICTLTSLFLMSGVFIPDASNIQTSKGGGQCR